MYRLIVAMMLVFMAGCGRHGIQIGAELNLEEGISQAFSTPFLQSYEGCEELKQDLKATALREMNTRMAMLLSHRPTNESRDYGYMDMIPAPTCPPMPPSAAMAEGVDFSGTNNQEKGVDEADIIKIDGHYFYILHDGKLEILAIEEGGVLKPVSALNLGNAASSLLLLGEKALVLEADRYRHEHGVVNAHLIDLSADRKNPHVLKSFYFQGELLAARTIGKSVHLATFYDASMSNLRYDLRPSDDFFLATPEEQEELWPQMVARLRRHNERLINDFDFLSLLPTELADDAPRPLSESDCAHSYGAHQGSAQGFVSLITITPEKEGARASTHYVKGNKPIVYASPDQVILASPEHQPWWFFSHRDEKDQTTIHRFKLDDDSSPNYADSVVVPGTLKNSFSLSEYQGYLRLATTTAGELRAWERPSDDKPWRPDENHLYILGEKEGRLEIVSSIEALAPGEQIWSARFSKDKGFLVTFKRVDPLFTLDLSDPLKPKVAGQLKIPGVSTYLQDIGEDQLLAVGYGGDENGLNFETTVSLFDVSDFANPALKKTLRFAVGEDLDSSWSNFTSEANDNHLAINYWGPAQMTAIAVSSQRYVSTQNYSVDGQSFDGQWQYISKLMLINTAANKDLTIYGQIDHSKFYNNRSPHSYESPQIRRSYFVGDYLYAISQNAITATRLSDLKSISDVVLQ